MFGHLLFTALKNAFLESIFQGQSQGRNFFFFFFQFNETSENSFGMQLAEMGSGWKTLVYHFTHAQFSKDMQELLDSSLQTQETISFPLCLSSPKYCAHRLKFLTIHKSKDDYPEDSYIISLLPVCFCSFLIYINEIAKTNNFAEIGMVVNLNKVFAFAGK